MFKKMTVLAMAVGVVAALALPASASAVWTENHSKIQVDKQLLLTGQARFQGTLGGVECQITSQTILHAVSPTTTATANTFKPDNGTDTEKCKGLGGLAFCQIHNLAPQHPTWSAHTLSWQTTQLEQTGGGVHHTKAGATDLKAAVVTTQSITSQTTGAFCPGVQQIHLEAGNVALIPDGDPDTVKTGQLNGILQAKLTTGATVDTEEVLVSGAIKFQNVSEEGKYGF